MAPINRFAEPHGNSVSESNVSTYRILRQTRNIAGFDGKRIGVIAKEPVEIEQFASLAFPAHPSALARIIEAMAVE